MNAPAALVCVSMDSPDRHGAPRRSDNRADGCVDYHDASGTYRTEFDGGSRPPSAAVVAAVAAATDRDPLALPPLYAAVDPEALDGIVATLAGGGADPEGCVTFEYTGWHVTVNCHGTVQVEPVDDATGD